MKRATLKAPEIDPLVERLGDRKLATAAAAQYLDVHPVTMRKWRRCNTGPAWVVSDGGNVRYTLAELRRWSEGAA